MSNKLFITRNEAAAQMGVSPQSISNYVERGLIKATRHGQQIFIDRKSFEDFIHSYTGQEVKDKEIRLNELQNEVDSLRKELQEEKDRLQSQIARITAKRSYNAILTSGVFSDFIERLVNNTDTLNHREREIIRRVSKGESFSDMANDYSITRERIRVIFHRGLTKAMQKYRETVNHISMEKELYERVEKQKGHIAQQEATIKALRKKLDINNKEYDSEVKRIRSLVSTDARKYLLDRHASIRLMNCIISVGNISLFDLVSMREKDLTKIRNFGRKSQDELTCILQRDNLTIDMTFDRDIVDMAMRK